MILAGNRVTAVEMPQAPHDALSPDVVKKLEAEIKELRGQLPSQSHTMADVAYHFSNLWFAGQARNWPLAEFYWDETRSHLRWAVRVRPVRPLSTGGEFHLADMLAGIEKGPLSALQGSIKAEDAAQFFSHLQANARELLCMSCRGRKTLPSTARPGASARNYDRIRRLEAGQPGFGKVSWAFPACENARACRTRERCIDLIWNSGTQERAIPSETVPYRMPVHAP